MGLSAWASRRTGPGTGALPRTDICVSKTFFIPEPYHEAFVVPRPDPEAVVEFISLPARPPSRTSMTRMTTPGLDDVFLDITHWLKAAAQDRHHPMHIGALASLGTAGHPRLRSVVLREASERIDHLAFHTDRRSDKYAELLAEPRCALLFYAPEAKVQIRVEGRADLHIGDTIAQAAWDASHRMSRECYRVQPGPGTTIASHANLHRAEDDTLAFAQFCRVIVTVQVIEWLWLAAEGHRRARFVQDAGRWSGAWIVP